MIKQWQCVWAANVDSFARVACQASATGTRTAHCVQNVCRPSSWLSLEETARSS